MLEFSHSVRRRQRGAVTIEYALMLMFGIIPLLLFTFSGVMIFAAQQSLALAAGEGARAALRHGDTATRRSNACLASQRSMQWLLSFSGQTVNCSTANAAPIIVSMPTACASDPLVQCIAVEVSYNYNSHPFLPGTGRLYGWVLGSSLRSRAIVQLDLGSN